MDIEGMQDVYGDLNDFEKRVKGSKDAYAYTKQQEDSSDEEPQIDRANPVQVLEEKNRMLMERLFKSEKQLNEMKDTYEAVVSDKDSLKDKKIIDLAKKNRVLQVQAESLKDKASKAAEFAISLKKDQDSGKNNESIMSGSPSKNFDSQIGGMSQDQKNKLKDMEKRVTKLRNENQEQKILLEKATRLLEREIGEVVDIHDLSKEDSQWKGRSQKVEILKSQVKKLKSQGFGGMSVGMGENSVMTDGGLSVISENTVFTGKITHAERNLSKLGEKKKENVDQLKYQVEELQEEIKELKQKYKGAVSRRDTLENQMKTIKTDFGMKIKMLLDKTENDDKLIGMLKQEIARLENLKGVKSQLKTDDSANQQAYSEMAKFKTKVANLTNQVKCYEIEIEQKNEKITHLMTNIVGAPDERLEDKDALINDLEEKCEELERTLFKTKQEFKESGEKRFPKKSKDEQERIIQDLTKSNAMLRRKLDDAQQKLTKQ